MLRICFIGAQPVTRSPKNCARIFSGLTKIEKATLGRLRSGKFVRPWIIKRFARGLHLNAVDRAELYIRYGEMLIGWHRWHPGRA